MDFYCRSQCWTRKEICAAFIFDYLDWTFLFSLYPKILQYYYTQLNANCEKSECGLKERKKDKKIKDPIPGPGTDSHPESAFYWHPSKCAEFKTSTLIYTSILYNLLAQKRTLITKIRKNDWLFCLFFPWVKSKEQQMNFLPLIFSHEWNHAEL